MIEQMKSVITKFQYEGEPYSCQVFGNGHINTTFRVECDRDGKITRYILQSVNTNVFSNVSALMENIQNVTSFLREKIRMDGGDISRETLTLIPTREGKTFYTDANGVNWRSYLLIQDAECLEKIESPETFYYCGYAFGSFQNLLSDFPAFRLHEVIPDFHNTPARFVAFQKALEADVCGRKERVADEIDFIQSRAEEMSILVDMCKRGEIPLRVTHNDTKLNNCLFDVHTGKPICVIDLDTVMPGLIAYDYGDAIRFGAATGDEDETDLEKVHFSLPLYESYTKGFLAACRSSMTQNEIRSLPVGAKLMTLECGMRFLTDYLEGDHYFRITREDQNLDRCRTQLKLVADMERQWDKMNEILCSLDVD